MALLHRSRRHRCKSATEDEGCVAAVTVDCAPLAAAEASSRTGLLALSAASCDAPKRETAEGEGGSLDPQEAHRTPRGAWPQPTRATGDSRNRTAATGAKGEPRVAAKAAAAAPGEI